MAKVKDLRSYFKQSEKNNDLTMPNVPTCLCPASGNVSTTEFAIVGEEIKKSCQPRRNYITNVSESIKLEIGNYAN